MDTAASTARRLPTAAKIPILLAALQTALGKLGLAVAKHAKYIPTPTSQGCNWGVLGWECAWHAWPLLVQVCQGMTAMLPAR